MIFTKFVIVDLKKHKARTFHFTEGVNIITASINKGGKSSVLKSLYYALGVNQKNFKPEWNYGDMLFVVYYQYNKQQGIIARKGKEFFFTGKNEDSLKSQKNKEYSEWFLDLVSLNIKVPFKNDPNTLRPIYAEVLWAAFYIDQDVSMSGGIHAKTINKYAYGTGVFPKEILEYCLGIKRILNIEKKETLLNEEKKIVAINMQLNTLGDLQPLFIKNVVPFVHFNEEKIKKNIESYLLLADKLTGKIVRYQSSIYTGKVKLDSLKLERNELIEILKQSDMLYADYSKGICETCKNPVNDKHLENRISLDTNTIAIREMIVTLERSIDNVQAEINENKEKEIFTHNEHREITSLLENDKEQLSLKQYLESSAETKLNEKYFSVLDGLQEDKEKTKRITEKLRGEIDKEEKKEKDLRKNIAAEYKKFLATMSSQFSISLDSNEKGFLVFSDMKNSGSTYTELHVLYYMVYAKLLLKYGVVDLPFGIDTIIKDDFTDPGIENLYSLIEDTLFTSGRQVFFVALKKRIEFFKDQKNLNIIEVDKDRDENSTETEWVLSSVEYRTTEVQNIINGLERALI